jgi:hypothetical protein
MLVVLGVMSAGWMAAIAVLVTAQKLLPPRAALEAPLALAIGRIRGCDHRGPLVGAPGCRRRCEVTSVAPPIWDHAGNTNENST